MSPKSAESYDAKVDVITDKESSQKDSPKLTTVYHSELAS